MAVHLQQNSDGFTSLGSHARPTGVTDERSCRGRGVGKRDEGEKKKEYNEWLWIPL